VIQAFNDTIEGRGNKGTVLVCAAGNDGTNVDFPARHSRAIAVGACGPLYQETDYSNYGADLHVVAPSSHENTYVYSTDVSGADWGFNTSPSGDAGSFWDEFGQTSAAAAMAAGVAALCLSANPNLTAAEVRSVLQDTARKVGIKKNGNNVVYNAVTHRSVEFGYGCIDADEAVKTAKAMLTP
jgi:subtilisin family serine protease